MLNFFDSVSCETIIAENEAYEQVLAMVRLHLILNMAHFQCIKETIYRLRKRAYQWQ